MLTKELETMKVLTQVESSNKLDLVNMPKNIVYKASYV